MNHRRVLLVSLAIIGIIATSISNSLADSRPGLNTNHSTMSFLAGHRALDVDYEDGKGSDYLKFYATFHGPMRGLNFKW